MRWRARGGPCLGALCFTYLLFRPVSCSCASSPTSRAQGPQGKPRVTGGLPAGTSAPPGTFQQTPAPLCCTVAQTGHVPQEWGEAVFLCLIPENSGVIVASVGSVALEFQSGGECDGGLEIPTSTVYFPTGF